MSGFIQGEARHQATLFPEALDDYITEENPIRVIGEFDTKMKSTDKQSGDSSLLAMKYWESAHGRFCYVTLNL